MYKDKFLTMITSLLHYFVLNYRQDAAKRKTAGIKFTQAKNQHFRLAGATRCTDSREIWHDQVPRGTV